MTTALLIQSDSGEDSSDYRGQAAQVYEEYFGLTDGTVVRTDQVDSQVLRGLLTSHGPCVRQSEEPIGLPWTHRGSTSYILMWAVSASDTSDEGDAHIPVSLLDEDRRPTPNSDVVTMISWAASVLGVTETTLIKSVGIERSYRYIKSRGSTPRTDTFAKVWALTRAVRVMDDYLGGDLKGWFLGRPEHRVLLLKQDWAELSHLAVEEAAGRGFLTDPSARATTREGYGQVGFGENDG